MSFSVSLKCVVLLDSRPPFDVLPCSYLFPLFSLMGQFLFLDLTPLSFSCDLRFPLPFISSHRDELVASLHKCDVAPCSVQRLAEILQVKRFDFGNGSVSPVTCTSNN